MVTEFNAVERKASIERALRNKLSDTEQELRDLKEWVAYDLEMSKEDFDSYWRKVRVNFYK